MKVWFLVRLDVIVVGDDVVILWEVFEGECVDLEVFGGVDVELYSDGDEFCL